MANQANSLETEQKYQVLSNTSVEQIEEILLGMGLIKTGIDEQKDIYWDNDICSINNLKRGLRMRYVSGELKTVEFKCLFVADNRENFVVEEISLLINGRLDIEKLRSMLVNRMAIVSDAHIDAINPNDTPEFQLASLGLKPAIVLDKQRHLFIDAANSIEVGIDNIKGIPLHIEIELTGKDDASYLAFIKSIQSLDSLELIQVYMGYTDLLSAQNPHLKSKEEYDALFAQNPSWNVLESEKEIVAGMFLNDK
jgi:adenylate cyclase class IV